jgi:glucosyl-3-phosphoglycerate synthase
MEIKMSNMPNILDFHYGDYSWGQARERLKQMKDRKNLTVSLGLPCFNEEKTIEQVITTAQDLQREGLVDEIMVFDSGSTDNSKAIARKKRVPFVKDEDAAKELGVELQRGKGFNLWASTHYLKGKIISWVDTDLELHPRILLGTIGPLIENDNLVFVKGRYKRPEKDNRVTRYVAEPLLSMLFPELNPIIDPLCGQYSGRRDVLHQITFDPGYGVEVALLIGIARRFGPERIAQSYLGSIKNREHDTPYYGIMSGEIIYSILTKAKEAELIRFMRGVPSKTLVQMLNENGVKSVPKEYKIAYHPLPAMSDVEKRMPASTTLRRIQEYRVAEK